jgi:transposase
MDALRPTLRSLAVIQADIANTALRLGELEAERQRTRDLRRAGIVADFDSGLSRPAIAAKWGLAYGQVAAVLHKARRTERSRRARGLDLAQRADYERLVRLRVPTRLARVIALREPS